MNNSDKVDGSFLEVLLTLKEVIMRQLHVSTLALVKSVDTDKKIVKASPFPIMNDEVEKTIDVHYFGDLEPKENDVVLVLFLDKNYINNLKRMSKNDYTIVKIDDTKYHAEEYGILLQIIIPYTNNEEE